MSLPEPAPFDYEAHLLACARGERQALHRLYQHEGARLLGVARRLVRDTALAEDIVHDAFIRIWTGAGGFDPVRGSARGWMFSVTRHLALNVLRRQGREVLVDGTQEAGFDAWLAAGAADERDAGLDGLLQAGRLQGCLEGLEPQRRACIMLAYVDGCSHADIARRQGTPLGTVKAWIKRSLTALRECMG
ncbi:sigma-70 family RNA polymerase sigma factor [Pseudomonas putida]|uniref:sigma-70 family RNA polymerase sigma factor n=1 Tax=Pseudomonas putida TaxID=303 RepID=UPI002363F8DB|nr:sigma-70 family RNA polymerase sigma factor [Pseudomonas putida]MDD2054078.1 sigma-70 family RNA polymerase sigma factor [Pseudomonas putida]